MIDKIIKYEGTDEYIIGLCQDKEKKYYLFSGKTGSIKFTSGYDEDLIYHGRCFYQMPPYNKLIINLIEDANNNSIFTIIEVSSIEEYDKIAKVVEVLL